jgi:hypothetical protein
MLYITRRKADVETPSVEKILLVKRFTGFVAAKRPLSKLMMAFDQDNGELFAYDSKTPQKKPLEGENLKGPKKD